MLKKHLNISHFDIPMIIFSILLTSQFFIFNNEITQYNYILFTLCFLVYLYSIYFISKVEENITLKYLEFFPDKPDELFLSISNCDFTNNKEVVNEIYNKMKVKILFSWFLYFILYFLLLLYGLSIML